jgi:hypothetical protein
MIQVLRNHTHGSKIILSICQSKGVRFAKKSSYSRGGIDELKRELAGYYWYLNQRNSGLIIENFSIENSFFQIRIPFFETKGRVRKILSNENVKFYIKAIDHYRDIWCKTNDSCAMLNVHGDFSLDGNILFYEDSIFVIDWEHFSEKLSPKGFDVLYMIFEAIKIYCGTRKPDYYILNLGKNLIQYAHSVRVLDEIYANDVLGNFLVEQEKIDTIWGDQKGKVPTRQFTSEQLRIMLPHFNSLL